MIDITYTNIKNLKKIKEKFGNGRIKCIVNRVFWVLDDVSLLYNDNKYLNIKYI